MKLYEWWEKEYAKGEYSVKVAKEMYDGAVKKLQMISWTENYPSDVPQMQGLARAMAGKLNLNLWKTYPKTL